MKKLSSFLFFGIKAFIVLIIFINCIPLQSSIPTEILIANKLQDRILRLEVQQLVKLGNGLFRPNTKIITEKATPQIIKNTIASIDWKQPTFISLIDTINYDCSLQVSGVSTKQKLSLEATLFPYEKENVYVDLETVEQVTQALIYFLKGEDVWRNEYEKK